MEYTTNTKLITIIRRIDPTDTQKHFILHNCNKRRYIWNKFVEKYREDYKTFDPDSVREYLISEDVNTLMDEDTDDTIKDMYCVDIILGVYKDVKAALKKMRSVYKKTGNISKLQFRRKDVFRETFKVRTKNEISNSTGDPRGKVHFKNTTKFEFRAAHDHVSNKFNFKLMEPISDEYDKFDHEFITYDKHSYRKRYSFHHDDIKEIVFMKELGKYYIMLKCKVTYYNYKDELKAETAGIDLGIHNPVSIHDGKRTFQIAMSPKQLANIQYYVRRCGKIQSAMDRKLLINTKRNEADPNYPRYSKRYRKLQCRFRRYWKHVRDIRLDWRHKLANSITNKYDNIVVDEFTTPNNKQLKACNKLKRLYNRYNRMHAMSLFMEVLHHTAEKNGCCYIDSPKNTTRTCAICGHVNPKLPLSVRNLVCENCNNTIDRDANAAMNCYDFYYNRSHWSLD